MKKPLIGLLILGLSIAIAAMAAEPRGRVDTRKLAGQVNFTQDEFDRLTKAVVLSDGRLSYSITNANEGVIVVASTNITALVHIVLPDPLYNIGRKFEIIGTGPVSVVLTNTTLGGMFRSNLVSHSSYQVSSNRTIRVYSTGEDYICKDN